MEVCGRWLPSGVPNCEQGKEERNTAVTRLERTSLSVWVCVHTELEKTSLSGRRKHRSH